MGATLIGLVLLSLARNYGMVVFSAAMVGIGALRGLTAAHERQLVTTLARCAATALASRHGP
jgi:hypothetical protein